MDFAHRVQRELGDVALGAEAEVRGRDEDVVDIEQQATAGAPGELGQKTVSLIVLASKAR
jgi:hypothetical protein